MLNSGETDSRVLALDVVALVFLEAVDADGVGGSIGGAGVVGGTGRDGSGGITALFGGCRWRSSGGGGR